MLERRRRVLAPGHELFYRDPISRAESNRMVTLLRNAGVLMGVTGRYGNVLKLRPPLPFDRDHADHALDLLDRCLREFSETAAGDASS